MTDTTLESFLQFSQDGPLVGIKQLKAPPSSSLLFSSPPCSSLP